MCWPIIPNLGHEIDLPVFSPADLVILRWAYKHVREIARRMEFYRGGCQAKHPTFAPGSQAAIQQTGTPTEISASKIIYSKEDDDAIDEFHRRTSLYTWIENLNQH